MFDQIHEKLMCIRQNRPLVFNATNAVTMNWIANGLLAVGASPVMSMAEEEIHDLVGLAQSIVINVGTLNPSFIQFCEKVCIAARHFKKPVIFDPVGAGASHYRTQTCLSFLERFDVDVIRGNASEIMALCGSGLKTKGVDSIAEVQDALQDSAQLSQQYKTIVVVSGATDAIVQRNKIQCFQRGSAMMPMVTGSGCLLTAVIGAFCAVSSDYFEASAAAVLYYSVCGELAAKQSKGPGSLQMALLDQLAGPLKREHYETN